MIHDYLQSVRIACFSMEAALRSEIRTYAGGLDILAGDTVRSAADLELPLMTLTLASRGGYFRHSLGITKNAALFNSHRMMRRYATDACLG